jgi:hypothetical protein
LPSHDSVKGSSAAGPVGPKGIQQEDDVAVVVGQKKHDIASHPASSKLSPLALLGDNR